ncbi:MAG: S41 family peptidase [Steroidobacteraceae bacterium]|jgi:hypothetical protein
MRTRSSETRAHRSRATALVAAGALLLAVGAPGARLHAGDPGAAALPAQQFDPAPWLDDLAQLRAGFADKYANFEWLVLERRVDVADLFARAQSRLQSATSEAEARAAIDRLIRFIGDGHVLVDWPRAATSVAPASPPPSDVCRALGYDEAKGGKPLGPAIPGYQPLADGAGAEFPAGLVEAGGQRVGVLRIGVFSPTSSPEICRSVLAELAIRGDQPCNEACADRIEAAAYTHVSRDLRGRVAALRQRGAAVLLVDLTANGGGSEWAEAAARIVSPLELHSERRGFVRGEHWAKYWTALAAELRQDATAASPAERAQLLAWAQQVDGARTEAETRCPSDAFWKSERPSCNWLGNGFYATGLLAAGDAAALRGKPWGPRVFTPAEYDFRPRAWHGPLLVLVDGNTGSAAEEFAAVLQDNHAAVVIGAPTYGAGCGHTEGGTPTRLTHSGGVLQVPDCVRIRRDGSNEAAGIDPDVLVGFHRTDGARRQALRLAAALPAGVRAAARLCARERCATARRSLSRS